MTSTTRAQLFIAALPGYDPELLESVTPEWAADQIRKTVGKREIKDLARAAGNLEIDVVPGSMVFGDEPNGGERMGVVFFKAKKDAPLDADAVITQIARILLNSLQQNDATLVFPNAPDGTLLHAISDGTFSETGPPSAQGAQVSYEDSNEYTQGFKVRIKDAEGKLGDRDTTRLALQWQQAANEYSAAQGEPEILPYPVCNLHFEGNDLVLEGNRKTKEGNVGDWKKVVSGTCQRFAQKLPLGELVPDFYTPAVIVDLLHSELRRSEDIHPFSTPEGGDTDGTSPWLQREIHKNPDEKNPRPPIR